MNFLAHLYLSPPEAEIIFGNFIADAVKGSDFNRYPDLMRKGIVFHRFIDDFTDHHPAFISAKKRLVSFTGRFSGVAADIIFDHFLAINWQDYSKVPLALLAEYHYSIVEKYCYWLPAKAARTFHFMRLNNWLVNYADIAFMEKVFAGMSRRVTNGEIMLNSMYALNGNYSLLQSDFKCFFPDMVKAAREYIFDPFTFTKMYVMA